MRRALLLVISASCGRIRFDPITPDGSPDSMPPGDACPFGSFGAITNLGPTVNSSVRDASPTISGDGLTLVFESNRPGGAGNTDLWISTRASTADAFGVASLISVSSSLVDEGPSLSADGLSLYFASDRAGSYRLYESMRANTASAFGPAALVPAFSSEEMRGPEVSTDGAELFYNHTMAGVVMMFAPLAGGTPTSVTELNQGGDGYPSLSRDGLTIYWESRRAGNTQDDIYTATRPAIGSAFSNVTPVPGLATTTFNEDDPEISSDGRELFFASDQPGGQGSMDLYVVTRQCL